VITAGAAKRGERLGRMAKEFYESGKKIHKKRRKARLMKLVKAGGKGDKEEFWGGRNLYVKTFWG
jgi:hypothetical protein